MESLDALGLVQLLISRSSVRAVSAIGPVVEIRARSATNPPLPLIDVTSIEIDTADPARTLVTLRQIDQSIGCIVLRDVLQRLSEHRQILATCFEKLVIGGFLVVVVPHQFLYERKLQLPSRRNKAHRKFYSPSSLLSEIEEALDPCEYRLRYLSENDTGYRYDIPIHVEPEGGQEIILSLQRIDRPSWADELEQDDVPARKPNGPMRIPLVGESESKLYRVVRSDRLPISQIMVIKLDHRGDFILAEEAFRILRSYFPSANITLICGSWNAAEARKLGMFDEVMSFDFFLEDSSAGAGGVAYDALRRQFGAMLVGKRFDLAVDFRLYDDTRELLREVTARHKAGFDRGDSFPWLTIRFNLPSPTSDARAEAGLFLADSFLTVGHHKGYEIVFDGKMTVTHGQDLIWGPYKRLGPGRFDLEFLIEPLADDFNIIYDIVTNDSRVTICGGEIPVKRTAHPRFTVACGDFLERIEFRLKAKPLAETPTRGPIPPFRFMGVRYYRQGAFTGVHQREAMALFSHLLMIRLQQPYLLSES